MLKLQASSSVFFILTRTTLYLLISYSVNKTNASQRYPYILPKCCEKSGNSENEMFSELSSNPCGTEESEVVLLPIQFFPAMSTESEHVEVKIQNLVLGLECEDGLADSGITLIQTDLKLASGYSSEIPIEFENMEPLTPVMVGNKKGFDEFAFSADSLLIRDGATYTHYGPRHFCISNGTANMTKLNIKTCMQNCGSQRPCIRRCCGGHNSILTLPPPPTLDVSFLDFCSTPTLESDSWNPLSSKLVGGVNNQTIFYQTTYTPNTSKDEREKFLQENCKLLYFTETMNDEISRMTLLQDGHLKLTLENKTEEIENFCIDGINGGGRKLSNVDQCSVSVEGEIVVAYVCSPEQISSKELPLDEDILKLPLCSCIAHLAGQSFQLPSDLLSENQDDMSDEILVTLTMDEKFGSLNCLEGEEDITMEFKEITEKLFTKDGSLIMKGYALDNTQFCIRSIFHNAVTVRTCKEKCSAKRPCINRCCSGNTHVDLEAIAALAYLPSADQRNITCEMISSAERNGTEWTPLLYKDIDDINPTLNSAADIHPVIRKRRPYANDCEFFTPNRHETAVYAAPYKLMKTGDLMEKVKRKVWKKVNLEDYCIEPFMRRGINGELELTENYDDIIVWRCWRGEVEEHEDGYVDTKPVLMASLYFTFSIFYVGIAVVYILRSDKEPVFRWSIIFCSISMTLTYCFFGYTRIGYLFHKLRSDSDYFSTCTIIGVIANFIYLNGFSWITVLCFDVWLTLTFLNPGKKSMKRLYCYITFTFTVPAAVVGTGIILDYIYLDDLFSDVLVPKYGDKRCLYDAVDAPLPYLYGPLTVLTSINFLLFFATVAKLYAARHRSEISKSKIDSQNTQKKTFLLYFKLFLLMGLLWLMEVLTWAFVELNEPVPEWAIAADIVTLVQPAFVFYFLVWNEDTKRYLKIQYPRVKDAIEFIDEIECRLKALLCRCRCGKEKNEVGSRKGDNSLGTSGDPIP